MASIFKIVPAHLYCVCGSRSRIMQTFSGHDEREVLQLGEKGGKMTKKYPQRTRTDDDIAESVQGLF